MAMPTSWSGPVAGWRTVRWGRKAWEAAVLVPALMPSSHVSF